MKLKYFGTAAAEGIPALFCQCSNCRRARVLGGRNVRTRAQALVDDTLLIDFPPDTLLHQLYGGLRTDEIKHCIITHAHSDHLYAPDLEMRKVNFAIVEDEQTPFTVYAAQAGYDMICRTLEDCGVQPQRVRPVLFEAGKPFAAAGYTVLPLKASHSPKTSPVVFVVEKDGTSFGYFHDTGPLPEESRKALATLETPMALVSLDCTEGTLLVDPKGHMNLRQCVQTKELLLSVGAADENTVFVLNHFSHNGDNTLYEDLLPYAEQEGFVLSYDGMTVEF